MLMRFDQGRLSAVYDIIADDICCIYCSNSESIWLQKNDKNPTLKTIDWEESMSKENH